MLSEQNRTKLDGIVKQMIANGESDNNISFVVKDFTTKYDSPKENKTFFSNVKNDLKKRVESVKQTLKDSAKGKINPAETGIQTVGAVAGGVNDIIGEGLSSITPNFVKEGLKKVGNEIIQTEIGKEGLKYAAKGINAYSQWKQKNPQTAKDLESVLNIASLFPAKKGADIVAKGVYKGAMEVAKTASKANKVAGDLGRSTTAQVTGLSPQTVKTLITKPQAVTMAEKAGVTGETLADKVKNSLTNRITDLSSTGKKYEAIRRSTEKVEVGDIVKSTLAKYGIGLDEKGKILATTESVPLKSGDKKALQDFVDVFGKEKILSSNAFMNARTSLSNMSGFDLEKSDISKIIAKDLRAGYDKAGKFQLTGLAELDAKYSSEKHALSKIKKEYLTKAENGAYILKDTAISKIANATNEGRQSVLNRLEKLIPGIGEEINIYRALKDIEAVKGQKVGAYTASAFKGGLGGYAASGGNPFGAAIGMALSSPQVAVPMIKTYGKLKNLSSETINKIIAKMKTGKALLDDEKKIISEAIKKGNSNK